MKKKLGLLFLLITFAFYSCGDKGDVTPNLVTEINGHKFELFSVTTSNNGGSIYVGLLDDEVNTLDYSVGKRRENVIILNNTNNDKIRQISGKIIAENDSMIIISKQLNN